MNWYDNYMDESAPLQTIRKQCEDQGLGTSVSIIQGYGAKSCGASSRIPMMRKATKEEQEWFANSEFYEFVSNQVGFDCDIHMVLDNNFSSIVQYPDNSFKIFYDNYNIYQDPHEDGQIKIYFSSSVNGDTTGFVYYYNDKIQKFFTVIKSWQAPESVFVEIYSDTMCRIEFTFINRNEYNEPLPIGFSMKLYDTSHTLLCGDFVCNEEENCYIGTANNGIVFSRQDIILEVMDSEGVVYTINGALGYGD